MDDLTIKEIAFSSTEYDQEVALRDKILRKPLGLSLYNENLANEINDTHLGAFQGDKLLGVLILTALPDNSYKMRQVAVDDEFQQKGIGKKLVAYAENFARSRDAREIQLHARKTAVSFYEKLGYLTEGDEFTEVNIPHRKMYKKL